MKFTRVTLPDDHHAVACGPSWCHRAAAFLPSFRCPRFWCHFRCRCVLETASELRDRRGTVRQHRPFYSATRRARRAAATQLPGDTAGGCRASRRAQSHDRKNLKGRLGATAGQPLRRLTRIARQHPTGPGPGRGRTQAAVEGRGPRDKSGVRVETADSCGRRDPSRGAARFTGDSGASAATRNLAPRGQTPCL